LLLRPYRVNSSWPARTASRVAMSKLALLICEHQPDQPPGADMDWKSSRERDHAPCSRWSQRVQRPAASLPGLQMPELEASPPLVSRGWWGDSFPLPGKSPGIRRLLGVEGVGRSHPGRTPGSPRASRGKGGWVGPLPCRRPGWGSGGPAAPQWGTTRGRLPWYARWGLT